MNFKGTLISYDELTAWILEKYRKYKVTQIRYFGSRVNGSPRIDSDIDVYIMFSGKCPSGKPVWTEIYNKHQIEFHGFIDFHDGYVPSWLIGNSTNELSQLKTTNS